MKNYLLCLVLLICQFLLISFQSFSQQITWARELPSYPYSGGDIASDNRGNTYLTGYVSDSIQFPTITLKSTSSSHTYLAKFNAFGEFQWAKLFGGLYDQGQAITTDDSGNIFFQSLYEGNIQVGGYSLSAPIYVFSVYIAKTDSNGIVTRVFDIQPDESQQTSTIESWDFDIDQAGNLYFSCGLSGDIIIDGVTYESGITGNGILVKYNSAGQVQWVKNIDGTAHIKPQFVACDDEGNIFLSGLFGSYGWFDGGEEAWFGAATLSNVGYVDEFVAKYDASGNNLWAVQLGDSASEWVNAMNIDGNGNCYIGGSISLPDDGGWYILRSSFQKFDASGNLIWNALANSALSIQSIAVNKQGDSYLSMKFSTSSPFIWNNDTITDIDSSSVIFKMNTDGQNVWHRQINSWTGVSALKMSLIGVNGVGLYGIAYYEPLFLDKNFLFGNQPYTWIAVLSDSTYSSSTNNSITGFIYDDNNENCSYEIEDAPLGSMPVVALPGPVYGVSDENGYYSLRAEQGTYTVKQPATFSHGYMLNVICPDTNQYSVAVIGNDQNFPGNDFADQYDPCTFLTIDFPSGYYTCSSTRIADVTVNNFGEGVAYNTVLSIKYPAKMIPLYSDPPFTNYDIVDSLLIFEWDSIAPQISIHIKITDTITCICPDDVFVEFLSSAQLTPMNGCYTPDTFYNHSSRAEYVSCFGGVQPVYDNHLISLFPNPSADLLNISTLNTIDQPTLSVFDLNGRIVAQQQLNHLSAVTPFALDLSSFADGMYILKLISAKYIACQRFIVAH